MMNQVQQLIGKTALVASDPVSKMHKRYCGSRLDKACQQISDNIKKPITKRQVQKQQKEYRYQPFQRGDCHILQKLDTSALLCIVDYLPLDTQAVLSQTCRAMRNILKVPAPVDLPYIERVDYLANLAKDRVDCWVCDDCVKIHKMHLADRPLSSVSNICKRNNNQNNNDNTCCHLYRHRKHFFLTSQHVELALKYTRLGNDKLSWKHKLYLSEILKTRICRDEMCDVDGLKKDVTCRIQPKVVEGRFLLRTEWIHSFNDEEKLTAQDLWRLLCRQGEECSCPTDYTFRFGEGKAKLTAWQDLGKGVSPIDLAWTRAMLTDPEDEWGFEEEDEEEEPVDLRMGHGPGDVRGLFESN
ncbi:hypothetical protein CEP53_009948 [Fusarium sp. AF-6]|nr:hypothetical protein CEP53_009948 [Fusarium sp. AF-6]